MEKSLEFWVIHETTLKQESLNLMRILHVYVCADICQDKVLRTSVVDLQHILFDLQSCLWWILILHVWVSSVSDVIDLLYLVANVDFDNIHFILCRENWKYLDNFRGTFRWQICFNFGTFLISFLCPFLFLLYQ